MTSKCITAAEIRRLNNRYQTKQQAETEARQRRIEEVFLKPLTDRVMELINGRP